jgi:hypothetical protein
MRSAPTLKIWITPLASVAMLEKLALLKMALCRAPALTIDSSVWAWAVAAPWASRPLSRVSVFEIEMEFPNSEQSDRDAPPSRRHWDLMQQLVDRAAELLG